METKCGMIELYIGETVFRQLLGDLYHLLFEQVIHLFSTGSESLKTSPQTDLKLKIT